MAISRAIKRQVAHLADIKRQIAALDDERKKLEASIIDALEENDITTLEVDDSDRLVRATVVYSSSVKIDAEGLKEALGKSLWSKVTRPVLDDRLLEDKVASGHISIDVVAAHSTEVPRKPYVKITEGK